MKRTLLLLTFSLCGIASSLAQWQFGFGAVGLGPVDRFDSSVYKPGSGMFFNLTTKSFLPQNQPFELRFGAYFDRLNAGKETFDVALADPINEEGEVAFKNYNVGQHFITRFGYKANDRVTFFTDAIVGHRKFVSQTVTGVKGSSEEYEDDVQKVHTHRTFRYGVGAGMRIGLKPAFGFEIRADYTRGNQATYFDMNSIEETATSFEYESETWPHTDLFVLGVALNWKLFKVEQDHSSIERTAPNNYYSPSPTYRRPPSRTNSTPRREKKKVTPTKDIRKKEEKKEEEKINW
ncbi:MAG: hypothetical protein JJ975_03120 [Bacteroidia bacterium]|nr:hypothetical protein [Bacteroidia bacterium]